MIETLRLELSPLQISDYEALSVLFSGSEVMKSSLNGTKTSEEVKEWLAYQFERKTDCKGVGLLAVKCKSTTAIIGYCGLTQFLDVEGVREIEIGYRLIRKCWGHGYATEAATAVRDYAFNELKLTRLVALIEPINKRSIGVAKKIGMSFEKEVMLDGYDHPDYLYSMSNETNA